MKPNRRTHDLTGYRTLGRSGLIVSPLAPGTMTFGNQAWGSADAVSEQIFHTCLDAGGNSTDSADCIPAGAAKRWWAS